MDLSVWMYTGVLNYIGQRVRQARLLLRPATPATTTPPARQSHRRRRENTTIPKSLQGSGWSRRSPSGMSLSTSLRPPKATAALRPPLGDPPTGTAQYPRLNQRHCSPPGRRPSTVGQRSHCLVLNLNLASAAQRPTSSSHRPGKAKVKFSDYP